MDQGLFSISNFIVNILLARYMEPSHYGSFVMLFSTFLLLGTIHTAMWTEPMLVYGSGRYSEFFTSYLKILISYHWRVGILISTFFVLIGSFFIIFGDYEFGTNFIGLALAVPTILYLWLIRRSTYANLSVHLAAIGGLIYLIIYLGIIAVLINKGGFNVTTTFISMGFSAYVAAEIIRRKLLVKAYLSSANFQNSINPKEIIKLHLNYGKWSLFAGILSWIPVNLSNIILGTLKGAQSSALLQATYNLYLPILHFQTALNTFFLH